MLDIQGPVVVVPPGCQGHVRAEPVPDLLVGLLGLAEPQVQALFDARAQHVLQDLLGLVDLRGRDLDAFELEQHAQLAPQGLHVRSGEGVALVQAGEDHLQALLDAVAQHLRRCDLESSLFISRSLRTSVFMNVIARSRIVLHQMG